MRVSTDIEIDMSDLNIDSSEAFEIFESLTKDEKADFLGRFLESKYKELFLEGFKDYLRGISIESAREILDDLNKEFPTLEVYEERSRFLGRLENETKRFWFQDVE